MAVEAGAEFVHWLNDKLRELNTDETVFGSYIIGILEGEENTEEKTEAIEGILSEIIESNLQAVINEIIEKWNTCHPKIEEKKKSIATEDVDAQLARILESQKIQTTVQKQYTAEELRIREQILAQYSQVTLSVSDEEDEVQDKEEAHAAGGLVKNTNAHDVQQAMKERREQAKLESQKKKEKDKEDREKQKQLKEEKKEKRKTVKGERRR